MAQNAVTWLLKVIVKTLAVMALGFLIAGCSIVLGSVIGGLVAASGVIGALVGASIGAVIGVPLGLMAAWNAAWAMVDNKKTPESVEFELEELQEGAVKIPSQSVSKSSLKKSPKQEADSNLNKPIKPELAEPKKSPEKKSWW